VVLANHASRILGCDWFAVFTLQANVIARYSHATPYYTERYQEERGFSSKVVSGDGAERYNPLHEQEVVSKWAEVDSKQHDPNRVGDIENKENDLTDNQGGAKCAPFENKSEQIAQIVQALEALTPEARDTLLQALGLGGGGCSGGDEKI